MSETNLSAVMGELAACVTDPDRFNETILGRDAPDGHGNRGYTAPQKRMCRSVVEHPVTLVQTGNMVGKSFLDAGVLHWFLIAHPGSMVVATAPSQTQLEEVLWKEVERSYRNSRIPLGGRLLKSPLKVDFGGGWEALAYSTTKVERFSGHHGADLLAIVDEASGVEAAIYEAIAGLNPSRELITGNPLRPDGVFYERCMGAPRNPLANLIHVGSLESPHIDLPRSPWGLADATWLAKSRNDYGEDSTWWLCHVLGLFPDSAVDSLISRSWLDRAAEAGSGPVRRAGRPRLAIDLGEGNGGDRSCLAARDDDSLLHLEASNTWSLETTAAKAALVVQRFGIEPSDVSYDAAGIGADFANRLRAVGIVGARPYRGGKEGGPKYANLRTAAAWKMRQRLDPGHMRTLPSGVMVPQPPFAIRPEWVQMLREEVQGLRYALVGKDRVELEVKALFAKRLKRSPDLADTLGQLFAF